jgi:predicted unusual protein kinase regulating ubiquinone biosynthesis (AarF/ABC1/UbiB family)
MARLGAAGAGAVGRSSLGELRKLGAGPERRAAIDAEVRETNAERIAEVLAELRGPLLKVGQILSQQAHTLPEPYVRRLARLQRSAPPMHGTLARLRLRDELGRPPEEVFERFEREPFAAASLGQVHRARLASGEELAVKIQYPGIERSIEADFQVLERLLGLAGWSASHPELAPVLEEVRRHLDEETDYVREADALEEMARGLAGDERFRVPRVHRRLSTRKVLTMERLEGMHADELLRSGASQEERDRLATRLLELFFFQTMRLGFFQADPHPGNFLFLEDGTIGLLDFGCTKRLDRAFVDAHQHLYRIPVEDVSALTEAYERFGLLDPASDRYEKQLELLLLMQRLDAGRYHENRPFDFGDPALLRELSLCLREQLQVGLAHPEFALYMRTKLGLYALFHQLGARVSCRGALEPYT